MVVTCWERLSTVAKWLMTVFLKWKKTKAEYVSNRVLGWKSVRGVHSEANRLPPSWFVLLFCQVIDYGGSEIV